MPNRKSTIVEDKRVKDALSALGWTPDREPESWLRQNVRTTLGRWIADARRNGITINGLDDVLRVVADRLRVKIEHVESDGQLDTLADGYARAGEFGFATLQRDFSGGIEGAVVRLKNPSPWERQFVAVVDARGNRSAARFFGACHEVGHPFLEPQLSLGFRCRQGAQKPLEKAVDIVASEIAFYAPLARPALLERTGDDLSYRAVEGFWQEEAPFSSRTAAFSAAIRLWDSPAMLVIAERHAAKHGRDGDNPPLRAVSTIRNDSALAVGAYIPKYRVTPQSAIYQAFVDPMRSVHEQREDLSWWQSSSGSALASGEVFVGARRTGDKVFALLRLP